MSPNISGQVLNFHNTGKIRIIAINGKERLKAAPDVPTAIEQGVPDMVGQLFLGIYAPAATPKAAIDAISAATKKAVDNPEFEKILTASGFTPAPYFTADSARTYMAEEFKRWKPVVDAIGLKTN
jgi:tripartite-type tricarboxylate transporter receptor subunit TctC